MLQTRLDEARAKAAEGFEAAGRLSFQNIVDTTRDLHLDEENKSAVFQVASLFNCLETSPMNVLPEDGITRYATDATQGSACAIACPAATVFRNYFAGPHHGQGDNHELDCLSGVAEVLQNTQKDFFKMSGGHCLPTNSNTI